MKGERLSEDGQARGRERQKEIKGTKEKEKAKEKERAKEKALPAIPGMFGRKVCLGFPGCRL